MRSKLLLTLLLSGAVLCLSAPALSKKQCSKVSGAELFAQYCSKCHSGGGNLIKASNPLAGSKQLENKIVFETYLKTPPGHMPYYQELVKDKTKLNSLYQYCKDTYKDKVLKQSKKIEPQFQLAKIEPDKGKQEQ
ncbi:MAG: cytochrome c [Candidatus Obscuribacterales bacterium]|nr:cytochrome c [Candidatus Obscuribacterales bacterium]